MSEQQPPPPPNYPPPLPPQAAQPEQRSSSSIPPPPPVQPYPGGAAVGTAVGDGTSADVPAPHWGATALSIVGTIAASIGVWVASKDGLRDTAADDHHLVVPIATFTMAGLLWGLTQPGPQRALRAGVATLVGAVVGGIGGFTLGTTQRHLDAFRDEVLSGASLGRAALWALVGACAWAAIVAAGTATAARSRAMTGAAVGGAAIGAAMGLLAGTPLGSTDLIATDSWFTGWIVVDDNIGRLLPVVILSILIPLVSATAFGRSVATTSSKAPIWAAAVLCLLLPFAGAGLGTASAIEDSRQNGEITFGDDPANGVDPGDQASSSGSPSSGENDSSAAPAAPSAGDEDSSAVPATPGASDNDESAAPSPSPATTLPVEPPVTAAPADDNAVPVTEAAGTPAVVGVDFTREIVATDIDVGFPIATDLRLAGTNQLDQGVNVRLVVGEVRRNDRAPATPSAPLTCSADPHDGVFPFYLQVAPLAAALSRVRVAFSQGATQLADTAFNPMTIEFHDSTGQRCENAVDPDFANTTTAVVWETLADGETGGVYGYFIVANYFDDAGAPVGAGSAVVGPVLDLNRSYTSWTTTVAGSESVPFDSGDGYFGGALYLTP